MFLRVALLACLCSFAASAAPGIMKRFVWCDQLDSCLTPYNVYGDPTAPSALAQLKDGDNFNQYCSSVSGMSSCVNTHKGGCWNDEEILEAETAVLLTDFLCASENRQDFLAMAALENTCLDDSSIDAQLEREMQQCADDFETAAMPLAFEIGFGMRPMSDLCPLANEMGDCMSRKVSNVCESQISEFFDRLIVFAIDANTAQFNCPARARQLKRLLSRSLSMLRSR